MKKNFYVLPLIFLFFGGCANSKHTSNSQLEGYVNVDSELNSWMQGFNHSPCSDNPKITAAEIVSLAKQESKVSDFYTAMQAKKINCSNASPTYYKNLAHALLDARKELRKTNINLIDHLFLLTNLMEDTLYVYSIKANDKGLFKVYYNNNPDNCLKLATFKDKLNDLNICQGDIVLGKWASPLNSILSEIMDFKGSFSHSTIAYVDDNKNIHFMESYIEDGAKLRPASEYYENASMSKLYLYRYNSLKYSASLHNKLISNSLDNIVDIMKQKTHGKPAEIASWPYDAELDATKFDKLFCTEFSIMAYANLPIPEELKPYPANIWSPINPAISKFAKSFLGLNRSVIASPSDIERNENYDIDIVLYDLNKLQAERVYNALMEATIDVINDYQYLLNPFFEFIGYIKDIKKDTIIKNLTFIQKYIPIDYINTHVIDVLKAKIDKTIPDEVGFRQFAFMGIYSSVLGPQALNLVVETEKKNGAPLSKLELKNLIRSELVWSMLPDVMNKFEEINKILKYIY